MILAEIVKKKLPKFVKVTAKILSIPFSPGHGLDGQR